MAGSRNGSLYSALLEKSAVGSLIAAVIWVVLGFAAANVSLFGQQAPFGAACCAAAGKKNALAAGTGAVLGYVFSRSSAGSLRYVAAVIIVFVMELVFERIKDSALLASALAAVSTAAVGTAFGVIGGGESYGVAVAVSESVLAGGGAYFFYMSRKIAEQKRPLGSLRSADRA